jgi:hypothetical protein
MYFVVIYHASSVAYVVVVFTGHGSVPRKGRLGASREGLMIIAHARAETS